MDPTFLQLFYTLSTREQGLTWLERYRILTNMSLDVLLGLQASVNNLAGPSEDKQWLLKPENSDQNPPETAVKSPTPQY